ncbi:AMP-binding protein [Streptomyces sp. RGM 3693]|uniref:AMP-binding protein n=1 Tax=Streptomyces sp. RGM 3693 TaxID=3413284 RepID=UPI003D2A6F0A
MSAAASHQPTGPTTPEDAAGTANLADSVNRSDTAHLAGTTNRADTVDFPDTVDLPDTVNRAEAVTCAEAVGLADTGSRADAVSLAGRAGAADMDRVRQLDGLLARAAALFPDRPALVGAGERWTYAEVERAVEGLASQLASAGVVRGDRLGVYAAKSPAAVLAIYAGLRVGAVVAPLDPADPPARTARMVQAAGLSVLLTPDRSVTACRRAAAEAVKNAATTTGGGATAGSGAGAIADGGVGVAVEADASEGVGVSEGVLDFGLNWVALGVGVREGRRAVLPAPVDQGGYVLFTSGSTGWPKGVLLSHANVAHFAVWAAGELGLRETDRVGSQASLTFDLTTFDVFSSAAVGACVVLMPDVLRAFPRDVVGWLRSQEITALYAVPSLYHGMLQQGGIAEEGLPSSLRVAAFAGEPFVPQLLEKYMELMGEEVPFYNLYGPTETNVCTYLRVPADFRADRELSVGGAITGDVVEVLDQDGNPTEGEGEIYVAGPTVFQGYLVDGVLRDPTVTVPFRDGTARRAYATGDVGCFDAQGRLVLRGRRDSQVKRRGHRIDLLDVESAVVGLPQVATAAVVAKDGAHRGEIWAYVQSGGAVLTDRDVLADLRGVLPKRMLPDRVVLVASLPLTARGKVDRLALSTQGVNPDTTEETANQHTDQRPHQHIDQRGDQHVDQYVG